MYYYIYRINDTLKSKLNDINIEELNKNEFNLIFNNKTDEIINGSINLKNDALVNDYIDFEIDLKYQFLFIITNHQTILKKSIKIIEPFFKEQIGGELLNFLPRVSKEHELICRAEKFNLKFYHDGEIVDSEDDEDLEKKYCKSELSKDFILIEADIELKNNISFIYFRKCLSISDATQKNIILNTFKQVMV